MDARCFKFAAKVATLATVVKSVSFGDDEGLRSENDSSEWSQVVRRFWPTEKLGSRGPLEHHRA